MQKFVLVIICILALGSGSVYAERSTLMFRAQKVDKTPNTPDKVKLQGVCPLSIRMDIRSVYHPIITST